MDCIHRHQELREVPSPALAAARGLGLRSRPNGGAQRGADCGAGGVTEGACRGASGWNIAVSTLFQRCFLHFYSIMSYHFQRAPKTKACRMLEVLSRHVQKLQDPRSLHIIKIH